MKSSDCEAGRIDAYIQKATAVTADRHGQKTIAPGDSMIVDPDTHERILDTPANREAFKRNGMSFYLNPDADMKSKLDDMGNRSLSFGTALGMNAKSLVGAAIPNCNLPWWVNLVPFFTLRFGRCREMKIRQDEFIEHLEKHGVIPSSRDVRSEVRDAIRKANLCRVYELRGWGAVFHVYAIFITHVAVDEQDGARRLVIRPANIGVYKSVTDFVKDRKKGLARAHCRCLSIGSYGGWDENLGAVELPDSIQALSSPDPSDPKAWKVELPNLEYMRPIYKKLVYRLWPVSWTAWNEKICGILKDNSFEGSMTVKKVANEAKIPEYCVAEVFDYVRNSGQWVSTRTSKGELALVEANGRKSDAGAFMPSARKWPWFLLLVAVNGATIGSGFLVTSILKKGLCLSAIMFVLMLVVINSVLGCVKNNVSRRIEESS